ncbi:hypothetical protein LOTGIDRAFT_155306 [Lottia gigantea]|uniref:SUEL-type lectin domain-containing protein n=1 Tax=Lottia gigantea TaxID=225164 RepID=V3ZNF2_LOTGI|nr:hypothetical protein LOTGIDRAFT_155306 [Lottia gigantea]ESO83995.1 hypothetical protein LOTGIDRAFT_155306 [Lottia gigantea]
MDVDFVSGSTNTSTVCYGPPGLSCATHRLSCPSPLVIQILNTSYGYRPECNNINGLANCINTTCCKEELGDCFQQFSSDENQQVVRNCSEVETCTVSGFREVQGIECGGNASAYSKIQYDCVPVGSIITTSTQTTVSETHTRASTGSVVANTSDVGSVVGGIFGAIIIIVIIIVVVLFLYKRRKKSQTSQSITDRNMSIQTVTPQYDVIDGPGTINNRKDTSGYDEIELDNKPRVQATAAHLKPTTINNRNGEIEFVRKPKVQTTDNYDHVGDDKLKVKPEDLDNYNHIGTYNHSVHEDNYNHIGNNLSLRSNHLDADYNHINGLPGTSNGEDDYNHIGDNDNNVITDDNYHHIGSGDIKVEGDYDHIGSKSNDDNNQAFDQAQDSNNPEDSDTPYYLSTC